MRITSQSPAAHSPKYRPEIDGLRAIAILPVVLYHAGVAGFSGGYIGVDIFFVISGYLIASIITNDIRQGKFSFITFYERRLRRIFPALFAMAFACVLAAYVLLIPEDFLEFGKSLTAVAGFVSNIAFWNVIHDGYFDIVSESQALLHTWSLAIEEQFYIFFPAILALLNRCAKGWEVKFLLVLILISFPLSAWQTVHHPLAAFYLLPSRAWELLMGAVLAIEKFPALESRIVREALALVGLAFIAYAVFSFDKDTYFPGFNALFPCMGAWLIIYSCEHAGSSVRSILSFRPLVFTGVISYSLYLWHWPILVFSKYFVVGKLGGLQISAALAASFLIAFLSFEFIEAPFRGSGSRVGRRKIFSYGMAASIAAAACGYAISTFQGMPERYDTKTQQLVVENTLRKHQYLERCTNYRTEIHAITDIEFCEKKRDGTNKILFWGDSHTGQMYPLILKLLAIGEMPYDGVVFAIAAGCPPVEHLNRASRGYHCDAFNHFAMIRALRDDVDTVFIAFSTWWSVGETKLCTVEEGRCLVTLSREEAVRRVLGELSDHIHTLKLHGKRVIVALPFPIYNKSIPDLMMHEAIFGASETASDISLPEVREKIAAVAKSEGAAIFDPRESLCNGQQCVYQMDGVSIYKDNSHIVAKKISVLEEKLVESLQNAK